MRMYFNDIGCSQSRQVPRRSLTRPVLPLRPQAARRNIGPCTHPPTTDEHVSARKSIARQHHNVRKHPQKRWTQFALYFDYGLAKHSDLRRHYECRLSVRSGSAVDSAESIRSAITAPIAERVVSSASGHKCPYVSSVVRAVAWRIRACTVLSQRQRRSAATPGSAAGRGS